MNGENGIGRPASRVAVGAGLAGLGLLAFSLVSLHSITDDAYIAFRYLDNWLAGEGLVFNAGERVEGYTSVLWIVLLAPLRLAGMDLEVASLCLALPALALLLWAVFRAAADLGGGPAAGWTALLLAAGSPHLARWTVSGMETAGFAALLALANQRLAIRRTHEAGASLAFGLAVLARPPGALHAATAFAAALPWRGPAQAARIRALVVPAVVFLALPLAHLGFRLWYYGPPLPNTFYVKAGADLPNLMPAGLMYVWRFLGSGGAVLVACAALVLLARASWNWLVAALAVQAILHTAYVVKVGGDYFPYHRFLVPIVPTLAVLGGVGVAGAARRFGARAVGMAPVAALALAALQTGMARQSLEPLRLEAARQVRIERAMTADWLRTHFPSDATLAVNAAGVIPYRTGMRTIDMLGLNDVHIARAPVKQTRDGTTFVGHFKHDGRYVWGQRPDVVITSGGNLYASRTAAEAKIQAAANTFPGDREFLRAAAGTNEYEPVTEELLPGRFLVAHVRRQTPAETAILPNVTTTAEGWFHHGLDLMRHAKFQEAIAAFQRSLDLNPNHPAAMTNMAFCHLDLGHDWEATALFEQVVQDHPQHYDAIYGLAMACQRLGFRQRAITLLQQYVAEAPDSPWKARARKRLRVIETKQE